MNPYAWVKDDVPWLVKGNGMYAPGHAFFFRSPDVKELYVAYHAILAHNPDDRPVPRHCCVLRVCFDKGRLSPGGAGGAVVSSAFLRIRRTISPRDENPPGDRP